jgi:hypothetical protein
VADRLARVRVGRREGGVHRGLARAWGGGSAAGVPQRSAARGDT